MRSLPETLKWEELIKGGFPFVTICIFTNDMKSKGLDSHVCPTQVQNTCFLLLQKVMKRGTCQLPMLQSRLKLFTLREPQHTDTPICGCHPNSAGCTGYELLLCVILHVIYGLE